MHLLLLGEALGDHDIDGGLHERRGDALVIAVAFAIIRYRMGVALDVGGEFRDRLGERLQVGIGAVFFEPIEC